MSMSLPNTLPSESKFTALDLKSVAANGTFEGYASLFNREDLGGDVVLSGAFRETLATRGAKGVRMLFQHSPSEPIGVWLSLAEDHKGLRATGRLMPDVARSREVLSLMRAGAIDGLSIGFKVVRSRRDRPSGQRRLEKVDLWEISVVTFPMLPGARVSALKAHPFSGHIPTERELERWLMQDAGLSRSEARALMRSGLKGLAAMRDAGSGPHPRDAARRLASLAERIRALSASPASRTI